MEHLSYKGDCVAYVHVHVLRQLKEELDWAMDKWLRVINNKRYLKQLYH